jgi:ribosomal-protein-alanine N-acetyltransferase
VQQFSIRAAVTDDIPAIKAVEVECDLSPWSPESYQLELQRADATTLVAVAGNGEVVGFITGRFVPDYEAAINNIGVLPPFRLAGIATGLVDTFRAIAMKQGVKRICLEVRAANHGAIAFYRSHRFQKVGVRRNFYTNPADDADVMCAPLLRTEVNKN